MIQLKNITLRRGNKILLQDASMRLDQGQKAGLIGRNGTGKSSLIQCLLGTLHEDKGEVLLPASWRIAHLAQELPQSDLNAFDYVREGDEDWVRIQRAIEKATEDDDGMALANHYADLEHIDGYSIDSRVATVLKGLGFEADSLNNPVGSFSGGWQMRLQLARVLLSRAQVLLLDEPTNHLDLETLFWLEQWLEDYQGAVLVISHDRDFLDRITTHTVHLAQQNLKLYQGNYTSFARQFQEALIIQGKHNEKIRKQKAHLQHYVDRFSAQASKAKQAQGRVKAIEKLNTSSALQAESPVQFSFFKTDQPGYPTLAIDGNLGYGSAVILNDVRLTVGEGDRIGVIGVNGSGKSTLLKSIAQSIPTVSGGIQYHPKAKLGYFSQQSVDMLHWDETPLEHMVRIAPKLAEREARTYLGSFDFNHDRVFEPVRIFSGGEKARLALALLIWHKPNVLILDEPTNHLDMHVREALILALQSFSGALLLVSHDRYFLECCIDSLWLVRDGSVHPFEGNLDDYQNEQKRLRAASSDKKPTQAAHSNQEKTQTKAHPSVIKKLEKKIERCNATLETIQQKLEDPALYDGAQQEKIHALQQEQKKLLVEREQAEEAWLDAMG
jgi:ATP-binding cassette, subfamily F, member 3